MRINNIKLNIFLHDEMNFVGWIQPYCFKNEFDYTNYDENLRQKLVQEDYYILDINSSHGDIRRDFH